MFNSSSWVVCTLPARAFVRTDFEWELLLVYLRLVLASSALPYRRAPPAWLKTSPEDVIDHIIKLARKGLTPSQIGVTLRDSHGVPQVRFVTGNKILRVLKSNGMFVLMIGLLVVTPVFDGTGFSQVSHRLFQKTSGILSRRQLPSVSISRQTGRTRIPSSGSF